MKKGVDRGCNDRLLENCFVLKDLLISLLLLCSCYFNLKAHFMLYAAFQGKVSILIEINSASYYEL